MPLKIGRQIFAAKNPTNYICDKNGLKIENENWTVAVCKGVGIWPLDSQLETEIHSFSQSPPPGVSKYHRGPFDQRPQGPWRRSQSFDLHFGSFFANFQSAVALSVSCWDGSFSVWSHQTWPTRRPILKNWAIWKFLLINLFQLSFSQKRDNGGVPPTLLRCPSAFWVSFGPLETNSLSSGWSLQKWPPFWPFFRAKNQVFTTLLVKFFPGQKVCWI